MLSKKWIFLILKALVSGGLVWFLVASVDIGSVVDRIQGIDPWILLIVVGLFYTQVLIGALRWQAVTLAICDPLRFIDSLRIFYIGTFFNRVLPGGVGGDAVRIYLLHQIGSPLRSAINGVLLERLGAVIGLVLLFDASLPFFRQRVETEALPFIVALAVVLTAVLAGVLICLMVLDRIPKRLKSWRWLRGLATLAVDARLAFLNVVNASRILVWSIANLVVIAVYVFILSQTLALEIELLDCLVLMPPVLLVTTLPISIGGWGVREGAMVAAFALVGVPNEGALALSVLLGFTALLVSLPGGLVWFTYAKRKNKKVN